MQARTIVVALNIPSPLSAEYNQFSQIPFDEKLQIFSQHIHAICQKLQKDDHAERWIISWCEYGLQNIDSRYISMEQRKQLKDTMRQITAAYPKLTIISGTVAAERKLETMNVPARNIKLEKVKVSYEENASRLGGDEQFNRHSTRAQNNSARIMNTLPELPIDSSIVRNISYVFRKGKCKARHDKTAPHKELKKLATKAESIFRPGSARSRNTIMDDVIGIEICREHTKETLRHESESTQNIPKIQFILSDSITYQPWAQASPYAIHIDSVESIALITNLDPADQTVSLYEHSITGDESNLKHVPAVRQKEAAIKQFEDMINRKEVPTFKEYLAHNIFDNKVCERLLALLTNLILLPRFTNDETKFEYLNKVEREVTALLSHLVQLNTVVDPRIKLLVATATANGIIALNAATQAALQRPHISDHSLVILAAQQSSLGLLKKLLAHGFDANSALADGTTALMAAANAGNNKVVQTLLNCDDIDINAQRQDDKFTALAFAAANKDIDLSLLLIRKGALIDAKYIEYNRLKTVFSTLVMAAIRDPAIVNQAVTFRGETMLHLAVRMCETYLVEELLGVGARINQADNRGNTPRQLAALSGDKDVEEIFVRSGGDPQIYQDVIELRLLKLKLLYQELLGLDTRAANMLADKIRQIKVIVISRDNEHLLKKLITEAESKQASLRLFSVRDLPYAILNKLIILLNNNSQPLAEFERKIQKFKQSFIAPADASKVMKK